MTFEEYKNENYPNGCIVDILYGRGANIEMPIKHAFETSATENGIQMHDLRKDPNDLPKGQINRFLFAYVKNYGGKKPMLVCYNGKWFYDANTYNDEVKVIQWCEIPQFKE